MKSPQLPRILVGASMSCRSIVPSRANDIMFFASTPFHSTIGSKSNSLVMTASVLHLCRASLEHRRPKSIQVDGWDDDLAYFSRKRRLMRDPAFRIAVWPTPYTSISVNAWPPLWLWTETMVYVLWSNLLFVQFPQKRFYPLNILCWYS